MRGGGGQGRDTNSRMTGEEGCYKRVSREDDFCADLND